MKKIVIVQRSMEFAQTITWFFPHIILNVSIYSTKLQRFPTSSVTHTLVVLQIQISGVRASFVHKHAVSHQSRI